MKVISIDPGKYIGLAYRTSDKWIHSRVVLEPELFHLLLENDLETVVCESFAGAGILNKYSIQTIELIGIIKGVCRVREANVVMQTPQVKLAWMDMASEFTTREHAKDAAAHLLAWEHKQCERGAYLERREGLLD